MTGYEEAVKPVEILVVEDNHADVRLIFEVFKDFKLRNNISRAKDGAEALLFLRKKDDFSRSPRPDIIILDLNLPRINGFEILKEIKSDEGLRNIPVVVLSTSDSEKDIETAYSLQANCFVTKPAGLDDFIMVIKSIEHFWLNTAKLPVN
ncbi:MAG TPA: response regulator [bacterium]|nr:response regulator [bacterium]